MFRNFIQARQDVQIAAFDEANSPKHQEDILYVALTSMLLISPRDSTSTHTDVIGTLHCHVQGGRNYLPEHSQHLNGRPDTVPM